MKKAALFFLFILILQQTEVTYAEDGVSLQIELMPWEEADHILPKYVKFTVLDVETGKQFHVQRRAGSNHADVQPLTPKDTVIMKQIYSGKWSWKRRAIIVIYKDTWIAASMHGMPHGAGALQNNFPGHFCIHFYGSTTHRTKTMDLSHMLMIYKAAGKLDDYLNQANPYEVVNVYIAGLKQQDQRIISGLSLQKKAWKQILPQIKNIKITRMPMLPPEDLTEEINLEIPLEVDIIVNNRGQQHFAGNIRLVRFSPIDRWQIDSTHFFSKIKLQ